jgi:rubrerythrin
VSVTISHHTRASLNDVLEAMRGEAYAYARYRFNAAAARARGRDDLAELFERTARVELDEHFTQLAALTDLAETDERMLRDAIEGELEEAETIYPAYAERAAGGGDVSIAARFAELARDEAAHLEAFRAALDELSSPR